MTTAVVPEEEDYVRISQRTDGKWQWSYHTAGNHEPSGGDHDQGFETPVAAIVAAIRVTGYAPELGPNNNGLVDFAGSEDYVWAVPGRA